MMADQVVWSEQSRLHLSYVCTVDADGDTNGTLARSQRMEEAVAVERLYQLAMNVSQINPEIMDIINHDEAIRQRAKLLGVPDSVLNGRAEVMQGRMMRQQQQMQQQQMMADQMQAETLQKQAQAAQVAADTRVDAQIEAVVDEVDR